VIGALLGVQTGRSIEIINSFELVYTVDAHGRVQLDNEYFATKQEQCLSVFILF